MTTRARICLVGTAVGGLLLLAFPAAGSAKGTSFAGSCSVQGTVAFDPPVTLIEQDLQVAYDAAGSCSGTLDGRRISDAPVSLHHAGTSRGSCLGAQTTAPGTGSIEFADDTTVPYSFEFDAVGTEVFFTFSGQRSGEATGHGSFLTSRTPLDAGANCAGSGVPLLPMDLTLQTKSALVSGNGPRGRTP